MDCGVEGAGIGPFIFAGVFLRTGGVCSNDRASAVNKRLVLLKWSKHFNIRLKLLWKLPNKVLYKQLNGNI